jgi:hypothetical protein
MNGVAATNVAAAVNTANRVDDVVTLANLVATVTVVVAASPQGLVDSHRAAGVSAPSKSSLGRPMVRPMMDDRLEATRIETAARQALAKPGARV